MLKSETSKHAPKRLFPSLQIAPRSGLIVLMKSVSSDSEGEGTVVGYAPGSGTKIHEIGKYSQTWAMSQFEEYNGEVTLKNT